MTKIKDTLIYKVLREFKGFFRSIWLSLHTAVTNISHLIRDARLGVETSDYHEFEDRSLNQDMHHYGPIPYHDMDKVLDWLQPGPEDVFVDIGCGKGRAVFMAALRKVKKSVGVELNEELLDICRKNLGNIKRPHAPVEFIRADAAAFDPGDEGTIFFMYNPFGYHTIAAVIANIKASLNRRPRRIRIVLCYHANANVNLLKREGWLEVEKESGDGEIIIYKNVPQGPVRC